MSEQLSKRDERPIRDFIAGIRIPHGRVCPKKLLSRLKSCISELAEWDLFQTGGSSAQVFHERLEYYRMLERQMTNTMEWYEMVEQDTPEGEWMKEFHHVGMSE